MTKDNSIIATLSPEENALQEQTFSNNEVNTNYENNHRVMSIVSIIDDVDEAVEEIRIREASVQAHSQELEDQFALKFAVEQSAVSNAALLKENERVKQLEEQLRVLQQQQVANNTNSNVDLSKTILEIFKELKQVKKGRKEQEEDVLARDQEIRDLRAQIREQEDRFKQQLILLSPNTQYDPSRQSGTTTEMKLSDRQSISPPNIRSAANGGGSSTTVSSDSNHTAIEISSPNSANWRRSGLIAETDNTEDGANWRGSSHIAQNTSTEGSPLSRRKLRDSVNTRRALEQALHERDCTTNWVSENPVHEFFEQQLDNQQDLWSLRYLLIKFIAFMAKPRDRRSQIAKALKWYLVYCTVVIAIFYAEYYQPAFWIVLMSLNNWIMAALYVLNNGIVLLGYLLCNWPNPLKVRVRRAKNIDNVLNWIELGLTIAFVSLLGIGELAEVTHGDDLSVFVADQYLFRRTMFHLATQGTHIFTIFVGYPRQFFVKWLMVTVRLIALLGATLSIGLRAYLFYLPANSNFTGIITFDKSLLVSFLLSCVQLFLCIFSVVAFYHAYSTPTTRKTTQQTDRLAAAEKAIDKQSLLDEEDEEEVPPPHIFSSQGLPAPSALPGSSSGSGPAGDAIIINETSSVVIVPPPLLRSSMPVHKNFREHICLLIACHKSERNIVETITAAVASGFPQENIYVAHNGVTLDPQDNTGVVMWQHGFDKVHYLYAPVGNKSIAFSYTIDNYILDRPELEYLLMIDDDVQLPRDLDLKGAFDEMELENNQNMMAMSFVIRSGVDSNLCQQYQHLEYLQAGFVKIFQAKYGSVLACHGAISMWRTNMAKQIFDSHNAEFHGEDLQMGLILRRFNKNYLMGVNATTPVPTTGPSTLVIRPNKVDKSLLQQRVTSWDMAAHHFFPDLLEMLVLNWERQSLVLKLFIFIELWTIVQDWLRLVFLVNAFRKDWIFTIYLLYGLVILRLLMTLIFDRVILSKRSDLQSSILVVFTYPFYNIVLLIFRFFGLVYNALWYSPWQPDPDTIEVKRRRGELPPGVPEPYNSPTEVKQEYWSKIWHMDTYQ